MDWPIDRGTDRWADPLLTLIRYRIICKSPRFGHRAISHLPSRIRQIQKYVRLLRHPFILKQALRQGAARSFILFSFPCCPAASVRLEALVTWTLLSISNGHRIRLGGESGRLSEEDSADMSTTTDLNTETGDRLRSL